MCCVPPLCRVPPLRPRVGSSVSPRLLHGTLILCLCPRYPGRPAPGCGIGVSPLLAPASGPHPAIFLTHGNMCARTKFFEGRKCVPTISGDRGVSPRFHTIFIGVCPHDFRFLISQGFASGGNASPTGRAGVFGQRPVDSRSVRRWPDR